MKRTILVLSVALFVLSYLLLNTGMAKEVVLKVGVGAETVGFDPHNVSTNPSSQINSIVYDWLVMFDEKCNIRPGLATKWTVSEDKTKWTFSLREGVKFHSGAECDALAVKKSFDHMLLGKTIRTPFFTPWLKEVKVLGKYEVQLITKFPYGAMLHNLAHPSSLVADMTVVEKGQDPKHHPSGTGAYMLEKWVPGEYLILVANKNYWGGTPKIDKIIVKTIPDDTTRTMMLKTGELDIAERISPFEIERLSKDKNIRVVMNPSVNTVFLGLNCQSEILKDVRVRQALNYAVDREAICKKILKGLATPANAFLAPMTWGHVKDLKGYSYSPEKARDLLSQAGWKDSDGDGILDKQGKRLSLKFWTTSGYLLMDTKVSEACQAYFREVGVDIKLITLDHATRVSMLRQPVEKAQHEIHLSTHSPSTADADWGLRPHFRSDMWPPVYMNRYFYASKEMDKLINEGMTTVDPEKRAVPYRKAQELIIRDAPVVLLYYMQLVYGHRSNVRGLVQLPTEHMRYHNAFLE